MTPQEYIEFLKKRHIEVSKDVTDILMYGNYSSALPEAWDIVIQVCEMNDSPTEVIEEFKRLKEAACG